MKKSISLLITLFISLPLTFQLQSQSIFEPGVISIKGQHDDYISISQDEQFLTFTRFTDDYRYGTIYLAEKRDGKWQAPYIASFSGQYNDSRSFISPDGNRIYFASNRPTSARPEKRDLDIWYVEKEDIGWSEPIHAGDVINSEANDSHPSIALSGNLYFTRWGRGTFNGIFVSELESGTHLEPQKHPTANSEYSDSHPFIDPDENYMLYGSTRDDEGMDGEVYITIQKDWRWSKPQKLTMVNSELYDYSAKISPQKDRIYFSRTDFREGGEKADIYYLDVEWSNVLDNLRNGVSF